MNPGEKHSESGRNERLCKHAARMSFWAARSSCWPKCGRDWHHPTFYAFEIFSVSRGRFSCICRWSCSDGLIQSPDVLLQLRSLLYLLGNFLGHKHTCDEEPRIARGFTLILLGHVSVSRSSISSNRRQTSGESFSRAEVTYEDGSKYALIMNRVF